MRTVQPRAMLLAAGSAADQAGRVIRCRGCGEIGRAIWAHDPADILAAAPPVTRLSGNFYLHHGRIACGRCQQIHHAG